MNGFSILMFLFALCVFFIGLYMFTGYEVGLLSYRVSFQNLRKDEWKNIGKWTMVTSIFIFLLGIVCILFHF